MWLLGHMPGFEACFLGLLVIPVGGAIWMNLVSTRRKMWEDIVVMELMVSGLALGIALALWKLIGSVDTGTALLLAGGL